MKKDPKTSLFEQISIFDILNMAATDENDLSSADLGKIIDKLHQVKRKQDRKEKIIREREEKERKEREARAAKEREEAHVKEVTSMDLPLDWENVFYEDDRAKGVHVASVADGLIMSLTQLGKVDIEYISAVTSEDYKSVIGTLKGSIYQNPLTWGESFFKGWETAEEYLSGNLMRKWQVAQKANEQYDGYFAENLQAIERVLPPSIDAKDIYITLGSPWVPPDIIDSFVSEVFEELPNSDQYCTKHDELTGTWEIPYKNRFYYNVKVNHTYGTPHINALHILERTLNMKSVAVTEEVPCTTNASGKKRVINEPETIQALEKQKQLIQLFQRWVWSNPTRKHRLEEIFESKFSCVRKRNFDGSFLNFPNMSQEVQLYPYQKNAVARILFTPNTLLAHDVGSGKTYIMIAAGMELKRMGISKKNMYVVPNNLVGQWKEIFHIMYPDANILCVEPKKFTPAKREKMLEQIRDEEFDGIVMAYSCFEQIPLSREYYREQLLEQQKEIEELVSKKNKATSRLQKKQAAVKEALAELAVAVSDLYDNVYFDELGVTRLFVDEAHNFKNVPIETKADKILGISSKGSKRCRDMMDKVRMVQKKNEGSGVVFATGTPITNSVTDAFVMQMYLQSGELAMLDLQNFDSWIGMFAERKTEFEIDVDTSSYRLATRFSKFHNLPELTTLLASIADFHQADAAAGIPETDGYQDCLISKTQELSSYLKDISRRAEDVRKGYISRKEDNMLKITSDGRKAALDLRLINPGSAFAYQSKVARCMENVAHIYFETQQEKSTQLIFCDVSTPKSGFNIYDEIKWLLVGKGISEEQIAYIHDANTEAQRNLLFKKVRNGEIRILLGSTFKLGLGVNIQDRLIALHHIDVPWRPADMTQREGRILRQGNRNPKVKIFRYITEGSFDAYSWQLLETKQRFITELLSGSFAERSSYDIEDTVLDYAEVKALAVGNPLVKERVEVANELSRYRMLQRKLVENRLQLEKELSDIPAKIKHQEETIQACIDDMNYYAGWKKENPTANTTREKEREAAERKAIRETISVGLFGHVLETSEKPLLTYRGFAIVLPSNMKQEKPYVWLRRGGKYYVELGETEVGNLIRIDHFLDDLSGYLRELKGALVKMKLRMAQIKEELGKDETYSDQIEQYKGKLEIIDEKLGVKRS